MSYFPFIFPRVCPELWPSGSVLRARLLRWPRCSPPALDWPPQKKLGRALNLAGDAEGRGRPYLTLQHRFTVLTEHLGILDCQSFTKMGTFSIMFITYPSSIWRLEPIALDNIWRLELLPMLSALESFAAFISMQLRCQTVS